MSVPVPDPDDRDEPRPSLLERLTAFLTREPEDRGELLDLLRGAFERRLLDADALSMIEGVLQVSEMSVRDVMIPRSQMDCVSIDDEPAAFIPLVIETKHSRFPVIGESKDDVVGILLAKELLNYYRNPEGFTLLAAHQPLQAFEVEGRGVDLQVSGHTHGGQMWPINYLVPLQQPMLEGRGDVAGRELAGDPAGLARVDGQDVPVERAAGGGRHVAEQVDLVVAEAIEAPVGHGFERGARVLADLTAQLQEFVGGGPTRRHGLAVAVAVGPTERGREAEAAGLDRFPQDPAHLGHLLGGGLIF